MPMPLHRWLICFIVSSLATVAVVSATEKFRHYGYALFIGVPVTMGLLVSALYQHGREWNWKQPFLLTVVSLVLSAALLLLCKIEGFVCILMAAVLVACGTLFGIIIGWTIMALVRRHARRKQLHCLVILCLPLAMNWEAAHPPTPPMLEQTTSIEVNAPPEVVWRFIPSFPAIGTPPTGWLASGVAYPIASEIDGGGVGATRCCVLSTGSMSEVVTVWEPGKRLEFDVLNTPPAMVESNPFGKVNAPHLEGYFKAHRGRFLLIALPGGKTRIEGTSWFVHDLWPQWYWEPVTRHTVLQIHQRVLTHIKFLAEKHPDA
jgi:hypothetical protein